MKLKLLNIFCIVILCFGLAACSNDKNGGEEEGANIEELINDNGSNEEGDSMTSNERLDALKQKIALKGLISKGDIYFNEREYTTALAQYLKVIKDIPDDKEVILKIGNIYYELKRFSKAYEYYKKIKNYPTLDKKKAIYSLINGLYEGEGNLNDINKEIDSFSLTKEEAFYYKNSLVCVNNFSKCRANFEAYFEQLPDDDTPLEFRDLQTIRNTLINYKNFQLEDLTYKAALVTGGFYQNGFYFISLKTGEQILNDFPTYKPILKIVAKSAYELGNYKIAKDYLLQYNKVETNDAEASYFLGRIYEKLGEKILSSVHLNKAINLGYSDMSDARRRLIFVYYDLDDTDKLLKTFRDLIDSKKEDITLNDYNLAVYYHIINEDLETAKKYSEEAKSKFPDSELFYSYYAWILLQNENITPEQLKTVKENIDSAKNINDTNPMLAMVDGLYNFKIKAYDKATIAFKNAKILDKSKEYIDVVDYWLSQIPHE